MELYTYQIPHYFTKRDTSIYHITYTYIHIIYIVSILYYNRLFQHIFNNRLYINSKIFQFMNMEFKMVII